MSIVDTVQTDKGLKNYIFRKTQNRSGHRIIFDIYDLYFSEHFDASNNYDNV